MQKFKLNSVKITGGFLKKMLDLNESVTLNAVYDRFEETGRFKACACIWKEGSSEPMPHIFWDSDVAKWLEGACYVLSKHPENADLRKKIDAIIDDFAENQWDDGYINSFYTCCKDKKRFTERGCHELYCAGHIIEAAIAYDIATHSSRFIDITDKYISLIDRVFRVERSAAFLTPGHEEIELALVKLYRYTGKEKYLTLAKFFIDERSNDTQLNDFVCQSHLPVREQLTAEGHAVRAGYLYTAMADIAKETNDEELLYACNKLYENIVNSKMYITGGIGACAYKECFTKPYDLPNDQSYAETCAVIALMLFADRMQTINNLSTYGDTVERAFYNGVLSGLSVDGDKFFYENPLEITMNDHFGDFKRYPITQRVKVFECSCCPPNVVRLLAELELFIFGHENGTLFVNQFATCVLNEGNITCDMVADYPSNGNIRLKASGVNKIAVRIPSWCVSFTASSKYEMQNGYAVFDSADEIKIEFDMTPFAIKCDERLCHNIGTLAIQRGPEVYCCESVDNGSNLHALAIKRDFAFTEGYSEELKCKTLELEGYRLKNIQQSLYERASGKQDMYECTTVKMIPYRTFANRGESDMLVWLREK